MSSHLSKELREQWGLRAAPIHRDDEVRIHSGGFKDREGKVTAVYRKKYVVYIERVTKEKPNGATEPVGIHPSNCTITKLKMEYGREDSLLKMAKKTKKED